MTSRTVVFYPIVMVLKAAEKILGPNRQWTAVNPFQKEFLKKFFALCRDEDIPEIESKVSWKVEVINKFLREHGFSIQLQPFGPDTFGVASILDLLVEWEKEGQKTRVKTEDNREFPGVRIKQDNVKFFRAPNHANPIACLKTKTKDKVYMTMLDQAPGDFDLIAKVEELSGNKQPEYGFSGLVFPMVDLDQKVDISWLLNMKTITAAGQPATIVQALQQTKLKMNEKGARAKSAVAVAVRLTAMRAPDHIINRPFLVWFERPGLKKPLFIGHITEGDWKDPGDISK